MTVHQAKGMQWPVVFVPRCSGTGSRPRSGGRNVWHLLPRAGIEGQARYEGTIEDERRLFYVAMTRSQKFLHLTWAPIPGNTALRRSAPSSGTTSSPRSTSSAARPTTRRAKRLHADAARGVANVVFSFSDLKYFFECPYQFKLRILYGFNAPIHEALGYGKSLHDALAEVHARAIRGDVADAAEVPRLVETHLHAPYAYPALRQQLEAAAEACCATTCTTTRRSSTSSSSRRSRSRSASATACVERAHRPRAADRHRRDDDRRPQVERPGPGRGRHRDQLHIYALGYQELTGRRPDYVEIYELDERKRKPRSVDDDSSPT